MGEGCLECTKWAEEIYWAHFPNIHFSQFLLNGFDRQLAIPKKFSDNLKKKLRDFVILKGPSGGTWRVGVTKMDDLVFFRHGWQEFVNDHGLRENDLLVFKYSGESHFDVMIFDGESLCEKEYSYFLKKCGHRNLNHGGSLTQSRETYDYEINNASSEYVGCYLLEKSRDDGGITVSSEVQVITRTPDEYFRRSDSAVRKLRTKSSAKRTMPSPSRGEEFFGSGVNRSRDVQDGFGSHATSGLKMKFALDEERVARSFSSKFPNFVKTMKKSNISGSYTVRIPYQFSTTHLPTNYTEMVVRNLKGECWTVNYVPTSKGRVVHTLCGGWMAFVRANRVQMGDICIFELVDKCEIRVHIARLGKKRA